MFISKNKFFFLTIFIVTLAVALMLVQPVSADDGTPADPTAATETSTAPELTVTETPAETTELPAIAAETPTVEATIEPAVEVTVTEPPAVEAAVTEAPTAADAPAEPEPVLAETVTALAESGLEVVDAEGETMPLATRD
jgi:DNA polymerase-3 subunit gamma/tau